MARGLSLFERDQWLVFDFREAHHEHQVLLDRATDFLQIPRFDTEEGGGGYPELLHRNPTPAHNTGPQVTASEIQRLVDLFAPELQQLQQLTGLDPSAWPTARVANGDLAAADLAARINTKLGLD
jgi:hypothetical protein